MQRRSRRTFIKDGLLVAGATTLMPSTSFGARFQPDVEVAYIKLAHFRDIPQTVAKGITIRRNFRAPLPENSWERGRDTNVEPSLAAYSIAETQGKTIQIIVGFRLTNHALADKTFHVRAVDTEHGNPNVLGRVEEDEIKNFTASDGYFKEAKLTIADVRLSDAGVGKNSVVWQWQYRLDGSDHWIDIDRTEHTVYSVLSSPKLPWRLSDFPRDLHESQRPWTEVLDYACSWAKGAKTPDEAATLITKEVYALGRKPVVFHGVPSYIRYDREGHYTGIGDEFFCSSFLDLLTGKPTRPPHLNCSDFASVITTFSNVLGCELGVMGLGLPPNSEADDFKLNPILPMGFDSPREPYLIEDFSFHAVAWRGTGQEGDVAHGTVFDAITKVDGDANPSNEPHSWVLAANMKFGEQIENPAELGYLHRFIAPGHRANCVPKGIRKFDLDAPQPPFSNSLSNESLLSERSEFVGLREPPLSDKVSVTRGYAPTGMRTPGWRVHSGESRESFMRATPNTRVRRVDSYWTPIRNPGNVLVEFSAYECDNPREAHQLLKQLLQSFQAPLTRLRGKSKIGSIGFTYPDKLTVLFRRGNLVARLTNVGAGVLPVVRLARSTDRSILAQLTRRS